MSVTEDPARRVFDSLADRYVDLALQPAERRALELLGPRLPELEMLDLGVGTAAPAGPSRRWCGATSASTTPRECCPASAS
ncbi:MAG: hypothetical protein U0R71_08045 [Solirubrobacterales bacterium]